MSTRHVPMHMIPGGQADFAFDVVSPFKALVGGLGSGKSRGAAVYLTSATCPIITITVIMC